MDNKTNADNKSNPNNGNATVRDSLVNTAVQFLQNPNTQSSPLNLKKDFLKKKGLTDEEVEVAIQRSGLANNYESAPPVRYKDQVVINSLTPPGNYYYHQNMAMMQPLPSKLMWLRDLANSIVALGGAAYIFYWFYKRFIEPYLFGRKKKEIKKDPVEIEIVKLKEGVERINTNVERLEQKMEFTSHRNQTEEQELIMHITSLKGLLLNRKQFPPTPVTTSTGPASIPAWQLADGQPCPGDDNKKLDNSPSNSSNNSTNNDGTSDSSLEVIKEHEIINSK